VSLLRAAALIAIPIGAAGSVALFFRAADHPPPILVVLFIAWLISPFALLGWMHVAAKRWAASTQTALHGVTLVIALASLAIYANVIAVTRTGAPKAAPFVVVAPASWLLIAVVVSVAAFASHKPTGRSRQA
jgi:hypothetical protein